MDTAQVVTAIASSLLGLLGGLFANRTQSEKNREDTVRQAVDAALVAAKQANEDTRLLLIEYREQSGRNAARIKELDAVADVARLRIQELDAIQAVSRERISALETQDLERLVRITALEQQNRGQQQTIDQLADDVTVARGREWELLRVIDRLLGLLRENNIPLPDDLDVTRLMTPMPRNRGDGLQGV